MSSAAEQALSEHDRTLYAFRRNVVIAASAGTGKTHRLSTLYVLLALGLTSMGKRTAEEARDPIDPSRIIATTFSRAAALEIRERIEGALVALRAGSASPALRLAIDHRMAKVGAVATIERAASAALERLRSSRIDTLHGVAADILRDNAVLLGLPTRLEILQEDEEESLIFGVIDETISQALDTEVSNEGLLPELASMAPVDRADAARALVDVCGGFFRARVEVAQLLAALLDRGLSPRDLALIDHESHGRVLRARMNEAAVLASRDSARFKEPARLIARATGSDGDAVLDDHAEQALHRVFSERKPTKLTPGESALFGLREELKPSGGSNAIVARVFAETLRASATLGNVERNLLALIAAIEARVAAQKLRAATFGFGDLLVYARRGLLEQPLARERVHLGHDVLMVDEFQDTSSIQRDLVYLMRGRPGRSDPKAAIPTANDLEPHGLFVVGDRKQSIYGFRGAEVSVFEDVLRSLGGDAACEALTMTSDPNLRGVAPPADFIALRDNYRSAPALTTFVNAFSRADFASSGTALALGPGEELVAARADVPGRVISVMSEEGIDDASSEMRTAILAAQTAEALLAEGTLEPRDIAILVRRRATIPFVEVALDRRGVPFTIAGRALFETLEARDLAALLRLLVTPSDRHSLAHIVRGPLVSLTDEALTALAGERGLPEDLLERAARTTPSELHAGHFADEAGRLCQFAAAFVAARPLLLRLEAAAAMRALLTTFAIDRLVAASERPRERMGNLMRLIELSNARPETLIGFSRWLDRQIADERDEAEAVVFAHDDNAVRLLTIHASKGLDFPVTLLMDLGTTERPRRPALLLLPPEDGATQSRFTAKHRAMRGVKLDNRAVRDDNLRRSRDAAAERTRLSYVAMTRARDTMVLLRADNAGTGSAESTLTALLSTEEGPGLFAPPPAPRVSATTRGGLSLQDEPAVPAVTEAQRRAQSITIAATPLGVFHGCPRRFRFRFTLGLEEPVDTGQLALFETDPEGRAPKIEPFEEALTADPRARGRAAHRYLETLDQDAFGSIVARDDITGFLSFEGVPPHEEGDLADLLQAFVRSRYAQSLKHATLDREHTVAATFAIDSEDGAATAPAVELTVRGTLDLLVTREDVIEVLDYKIARPPPTLDAYTFQLRTYAALLARLNPGKEVRAGLLFIDASRLGTNGELAPPSWLDPVVSHEPFERELLGIAEYLAVCRAKDDWPGVELTTCRELHCGFVTACHRTTTGPRRRGRLSVR